MSVINRPETRFDGASHKYTDTDGNVLHGVSTIAKIGEGLDAFGVGSGWGYRLGYEGVYEIHGEAMPYADADGLRAELHKRGLSPWATRDEAALRGNWAHDLLEALATDGTIDLAAMRAANDERQGHAKAILAWYLAYRPSFVATEVQVTSVKHGFAGRYDIRCKIHPARLIANAKALNLRGEYLERVKEIDRAGGMVLCLVDLKTSKRIYRKSHFVQLEGYEGAGVEMGYPATDLRIVLNTHPDGTFDSEVGYAKFEHFLAYLGALKAIRYIEANDPEVLLRQEQEAAITDLLPGWSNAIGRHPTVNLTGPEVGRILGGMRKRGLVEQDEKKRWSLVSPDHDAQAVPESPGVAP